MRARVLVGDTSRRRTGATRSGLIGKSSPTAPPRPGRSFRRAAARAAGRGSIVMRVGFDRGRRRDGVGDDLALHQQALDARVDQAGAELRQIEDADHQHDQAGDVEEDDPPRQAREALVRRTASRAATGRARRNWRRAADVVVAGGRRFDRSARRIGRPVEHGQSAGLRAPSGRSAGAIVGQTGPVSSQNSDALRRQAWRRPSRGLTSP